MYKSIILAALASLVAADFNADASAVAETASKLASLVNGWSSGDGLSGALAIQQTYDPLSSAVLQLKSSVAGTDPKTANIDGINNMASAVTSLLEALASKANDFKAVGAEQIVQGDLKGLGSPSADIVNELVSIGQNDCNLVNSVSDDAKKLTSAFSSAASVYGVDPPSFSEITCSGGSSESSASGSSSSSSVESSKSSAESTSKESSSSSHKSNTTHETTTHSSPVHSANAANIAQLAGVAAALGGTFLLL